MVFSWLLSIESWGQSSFLRSLQTIERGPRAPPAVGDVPGTEVAQRVPKGGRGRTPRATGRTNGLAGRRAGHKPGSSGRPDGAEREPQGGAAKPGPGGEWAGGAPDYPASPVSGLVGLVSVKCIWAWARN